MHAPISVLPVSFPRESFEKAKAAMQIFNKLIDRVSRDGAYLRDTLQAASNFDDFTVSTVSSPIASSRVLHYLHERRMKSCHHQTFLYCPLQATGSLTPVPGAHFLIRLPRTDLACRQNCYGSTMLQRTGASRGCRSSWSWPSIAQITCWMSPPAHSCRHDHLLIIQEPDTAHLSCLQQEL